MFLKNTTICRINEEEKSERQSADFCIRSPSSGELTATAVT